MILEAFFDYTCPYCYRGHQNLIDMKNKYKELEIVCTPCEAHPRPEPAAVHSDLAIQGMYAILEQGGDVWKYHRLMYQAVFEERRDISDIAVLTDCAVQCGADKENFASALKNGKYAGKVLDNNKKAWGDLSFEAVPSYESGGSTLGSGSGILVSAKELDHFISERI